MTATVTAKPVVIPQLIVGLGNPGEKYAQTRHNIGFWVVDALARGWQISWAENRKFQALLGEGWRSPGQKVRLLKPLTYMNHSGQSIRATIDWYKLSPEEVLVVYDDMDLPFGRIRLRLSGSAGGHNGMKSAIAHLGTQGFPRLRIGIGNPKSGGKRPVSGENQDTIAHVLGKFSQDEQGVIDAVVELAIEAIDLSLRQGLEKAMNVYNNVNPSVPASTPPNDSQPNP